MPNEFFVPIIVKFLTIRNYIKCITVTPKFIFNFSKIFYEKDTTIYCNLNII